MFTQSLSQSSNLTIFQFYTFPSLHSSNLILPIEHFFQSYIFPVLHSYTLTLLIYSNFMNWVVTHNVDTRDLIKS